MINGMRQDTTLQEGIKLHFQDADSVDHTDKKDILGLKLQFESKHYKVHSPLEVGAARISDEEEREILQQRMLSLKITREEHKQADQFSGFEYVDEK